VPLANVSEIPQKPVPGPGTATVPPLVVQPAPTYAALSSSNVVPPTPHTTPVGNVTPTPNEPVARGGPHPPIAVMGPGDIYVAIPQAEAGPSRQRESPEPEIGRPGHLSPPKTAPRMSNHSSRPHRQATRGTSDIKGKGKYRELSSGSEYGEDDELESEDNVEAPVIKQEPLADQPGFQAYAREVQMEMELDAEAERDGPRTRSSATKGSRRKLKAEPKTPAVVPDTDEEDTPMVVDRFAAAGENDPSCNNCASRGVTCQYVVDEWVTQCKLCQRQKVGCSVSAVKVLALKNSGRKRPRAAKGTTTRAPVKREAKPPKITRQTPAPRKSRNKRTGLGISSRRGHTSEWG
jgi:hypothetical protein